MDGGIREEGQLVVLWVRASHAEGAGNVVAADFVLLGPQGRSFLRAVHAPDQGLARFQVSVDDGAAASWVAIRLHAGGQEEPVEVPLPPRSVNLDTASKEATPVGSFPFLPAAGLLAVAGAVLARWGQ